MLSSRLRSKMIIILSLVGITLGLYVLSHKYFNSNKSKIPGYDGLPLIGVLPFLRKDFPVQLTKWGRKLGPIFTVKLGQCRWIVLSDYRSINETLVKHGKCSSSRPSFMVTPEEPAVLITCGDAKVKKGYLSSLMRKHMGDGNKNAELLITEEMEHLNEVLQTQIETPINVKSLLSKATGNIVSQFFTGKRKAYDDPWIQKFTEVVERDLKNDKNAPYLVLLKAFKFLKYIPKFKEVANQSQIRIDVTAMLCQEVIEECKQDLDQSYGNLKPVFVQILDDIKMGNELFTEEALRHLYFELLFAGTDTSATTLLWCILYLATNTKVQEKIWNEINACFGQNPPKIAGKSQMPLTSSFIDEVMRLKPVAPLGFFHTTTEAIKLENSHIKKGTIFLPLLYAAHRDPEHFKDPDTFISDRFVNKETGLYERSKYVIPFSIGPRTCLGYKLAQMEIFMFLCGILQKFYLHCTEDEPLPDFNDGTFGFIYFPKPFQVVVRSR